MRVRVGAAYDRVHGLETPTMERADGSTRPGSHAGPPRPSPARQDAILVEKHAPDTVASGERFDYEIRLENRSDRPVTNVVLVESLLAGVRIVSSVPASQLREPHTGRWLVGPFGPHEARTVRVTCEARRTHRFRSHTSVAYGSAG